MCLINKVFLIPCMERYIYLVKSELRSIMSLMFPYIKCMLRVFVEKSEIYISILDYKFDYQEIWQGRVQFTYYVLTHFRLNKLPLTIHLKESNFNFEYVRLCDLDIPTEKMTTTCICKQWRSCSDAALCGVRSGSFLFAYYSFWSLQI